MMIDEIHWDDIYTNSLFFITLSLILLLLRANINMGCFEMLYIYYKYSSNYESIYFQHHLEFQVWFILSLKLFGRFVLRLFVAIFVFILHRKRIKILHSYANVRFCLSRVIYLIPSSFLLDRRQKQLCGCGVWWTCWGSKLISNYAGCLEILRSLLEFLFEKKLW